jgi:hypothetical protein
MTELWEQKGQRQRQTQIPTGWQTKGKQRTNKRQAMATAKAKMQGAGYLDDASVNSPIEMA